MPPRRPTTAVVVVLGLLVATVVGAATAGPLALQGVEQQVLPVVPTVTRPPEPQQSPQAQTPLDAPPGGLSWLVGAVVVAGAALLLAVAVLLVRRLLAERGQIRFRGRARGDGVVDQPLDELADAAPTPAMHDAVLRAARRLEEDLPPGDAVIAAWVALERAAADTGVPRDPAQTATELTVAVLDRTPADAAATRELLGLYLAARYSTHEVTAEHVARARAALATIESGLAGRTPQ